MPADRRIADLITCLRDLPALEIKGVELLRQFHPLPGWLPPSATIPREQIVEAVVQLIDYSKSCQCLIHDAKHIPPIPLITMRIPEFGV